MDFNCQKEIIIFRILSVGVCFMQSSSPVKNIYTINVCELSIKETFKKMQHGFLKNIKWHNWYGRGVLVYIYIYIYEQNYKCNTFVFAPIFHELATRSTTLTSAKRSPTRCHTRCLSSALYSENRDSSVKRTPLQSARRHRIWAFDHSSCLRQLNSSQLETPMRTTSMQMSFPETVSDSLCRNSLVM